MNSKTKFFVDDLDLIEEFKLLPNSLKNKITLGICQVECGNLFLNLNSIDSINTPVNSERIKFPERLEINFKSSFSNI
jgi:hypothetical protein